MFLPEHERRSVALFCLEAAQYQLRHKQHFVLVHPVDSTFWAIPHASLLWNNPLVSWGRMAQCPTMSITSSFAKGQLDQLLCRHRAVKKKTKKRKAFNTIRPWFLHGLVSVAAFILGESSAGSHFLCWLNLLIVGKQGNCLRLLRS